LNRARGIVRTAAVGYFHISGGLAMISITLSTRRTPRSVLVALAAVGLWLTAAWVPAVAAHAATLPVMPIKVNTHNWSGAAGFGSRRPAWYKDGSGVVHLQGALTQIDPSGTSASTLGTLPAAARPRHNVYAIVHTFNGTYADLQILSSGRLALTPTRSPAVQDLTFVSLEGITYRPGGHVTPITLDTFEWSPKAGFGSRGPGWFKDRSGVVHLQGAVATLGRKCVNPCLIGTLPASAAPNRAVATIVHTFNGTYAGLTIATNGQFFVIAPRSPAVADYTLVSLESITFRPSGRTNVIKLNKAHWATVTGFGRRTPAWFIDRSGVVHLQGTAMQTSAGTGSGRIGTLPAAASPRHNVFTIVLTNGGTYADLEVARNGQLKLIAPRSPAITDFALVSLEGITYRR
jgi:hypothetical protein